MERDFRFMHLSAGIFLLTTGLLICSGPTQAAKRCGGTDRWPVKVGADSGAGDVDLTNVVNISVKKANQLAAPPEVGKSEHDRRLDEEKRVYRIKGRLVEYRFEDDKDYHLVITDDSLKFTPGGTETKPTGTSFIAEIPDPKCVPGKKGPTDATSRFHDKLVQVRQDFDEEELRPKKDLGGIPVTLVGVAFFDRPHGQIGRAKNNFELHPILSIKFDDDDDHDPAVAARPENIIENGDFEDDVQTAWKTSSKKVLWPIGYPDPAKGAGKAVLGGTGVAGTNFIYQTVKLDADATELKLKFRLRVRTDEPEDIKTARDKLWVQLRDAQGNILKTLQTISNLNETSRYRVYEYDLMPFKGRSLRIHFQAQEDAQNVTNFFLDDVRLDRTR